MNQNGVHKESKEKIRGKAIPKLEEKISTKIVNPSGRKSVAHSGLSFGVKLKKPIGNATESRPEQVDTSSFLTKKNETQRAETAEETILTSTGNLEISVGPSSELSESKSHTDERGTAKSVSHQCQGTTCNCSNTVKLLHTVFSPKNSTTLEHPDVGKDAEESHSTFHSKSVRTSKTANDVGKEDKTECVRQTVRSELKPQNRRLSKLRPPSDYRRKPNHPVNAMTQLETVSTPQLLSVLVTQPEFASNTGPSSEPTSVSVSSKSPETVIECSDADKLMSASEPSSVHTSLPSTAPDLAEVVECHSSDRPAFWPPSVPTYEIILKLEPSIVSQSNPLSSLECKPLSAEPQRATQIEPPCFSEPQSSKIAKSPQKCVPPSRTSRIPKIHPNSAKDTKVSQKNGGNPSSTKLQRNLKQTVVKTSSSDKRAAAAKFISDSISQKQTKSTETKVEISQKRRCK